MSDILIYLLDPQYEEEITAGFGKRDIYYRIATSVDEVVRNCSQDFFDLILIWPARMELIEDLLTILDMKGLGHIPVIPIVPKEVDFSAILQLPVVEVIQIPLPGEVFFKILERTGKDLEYGASETEEKQWLGQLSEFSLIELFQMIEPSRRDAVITLSLKKNKGTVHLRRGKVAKAALRKLDNIQALQKMVHLKDGNFLVRFTEVKLPDSIMKSSHQLLAELTAKQAEVLPYLKSLQELDDDLVTVQFPPQDQVDEDKKLILERCRDGQRIDEILFGLDADNLKLLKKINTLVQDGYLVLRSDINIIKKQQAEKKNLERLFDSISSIFKKEKKEMTAEKLPEKKRRQPTPAVTKLIYRDTPLSREIADEIHHFLKEIV